MPHNRLVSEDLQHGDDRDSVPDSLREPDLPLAGWAREGYVADEVDEFADQLGRALRSDPPAMAPYEVVDQEFTVKRVGRRYQLRAVDDFLDAGQEVLRERHGEDAVANLEGRTPPRRHVSTLWIYSVALVLVVSMVLFLLTQL